MEIVKAFTENNMHTNIVIRGTYNNHYLEQVILEKY